MTCSQVGEHHLWEASSTGAASLEDFMAVMCLEIKMGMYEIQWLNSHTENMLCLLKFD